MFFVLTAPHIAQADTVGKEVETRFFSQQKVYNDSPYVLYDYLEFTVFDMSDMKIETTSEKQQESQSEEPGIKQGNISNQLETELKKHLEEFPKSFYQNLKSQLITQSVPVTLYARQAPDYAKPLQLYIKVKNVKFGASYQDKKGAIVQPVAIRIYGQIKDKEKDFILTRFYDVANFEYSLASNQIKDVIHNTSNEFMRDLALFLKTMY